MAPADAPAAGAVDSTAANNPATTGAAGVDTSDSNLVGTNNGRSDAGLGWTGAGIDHIQVNFTRQQLQDAPAFASAE
jgi:hypothetical protein